MTKLEKRRLVALANSFKKQSRKLMAWNIANREKCGHSLSPGSLGDEGWTQLFINDGSASALDCAASALLKLVNELDIKQQMKVIKK